MADEPDAGNIRDYLGRFIGLQIVDITQQDPEEFEEDGVTTVYFHMSNGEMISFPIGDDGFTIHSTEEEEDSDEPT